MKVRWACNTSQKFHVSNGERQAGILSPYLFLLYMDDLSDRSNAVHAGCFVGNKGINYLMYADDLYCFAPSFEDVQDLVNVCCKYEKSHCIVFNASKSTNMISYVPFSKYFLPKLHLDDNLINLSNSVKYLGIH